jgi:hypothetical protein
MKNWAAAVAILLLTSLCTTGGADAQCAICTRTAQQMGERPAKALNAGIIYLAAAPLLIFSYIGYRWMKSNHENR